jgi:hypothetical protein
VPRRAGLCRLCGGDGEGLAANNKTHKEICMKIMGIQVAMGEKNIFAMTN